MIRWFIGALLGLALLAAPAIAPAAVEAEPATQSAKILVMLRLPPAHFRPRSNYGGSYGDTASREARRRTALRIAHDNGLKLVDGWPMPLLGVDCFVMELPAGMTVETAVTQVSRNRAVAWSQPMAQYHSMATQPGSDPLLRAQPAATAWRLHDLHSVATGRGVSIAVIDSKIQTDHPDLSGQFALSENFIPGRGAASESHGTGIAGVIGARENNGIGIAGVAPGARMMALRACWQVRDDATFCDTLSLARALQFSIERRAQVVNLSFAGPPDVLLARLIDLALQRGISVVAAFDPKLPQGGFPASKSGVVAVSDRAFPTLPSMVYVAPGRDVPTTEPGGKWYFVDGSSYATAHVSGLLALMRERRAPLSFLTVSGGVIDACGSLLRTTLACDCDCAIKRAVPARRRQ